MVDFVLRKHARISISISRTIFLTCFVVAKLLLTVILPASGKNQFLWVTDYFCRFSIQRQKLANPVLDYGLQNLQIHLLLYLKRLNHKSQPQVVQCCEVWFAGALCVNLRCKMVEILL